MIVGYNDLYHLIPQIDKEIRLQIGEYWDFTCKRKLTGEASGDGAIDGSTEAPVTEQGHINTEFYMDIMCCDPEENDTCKQVSNPMIS